MAHYAVATLECGWWNLLNRIRTIFHDRSAGV